MNASERSQAASSSVGKPTIASAVDRDAGERRPDPPDDRGVVGRQVAPAHPPEHAVVAGLERQVDVRQRPRRAVGPDAEQLVVDVLRLDRGEPDPLDRRSRRGSAGRGRRASGPSGCGSRGSPRSDQPPSYVPTLIPVRTISRWPAASARADVGEHDLRGEAPLRAAGRRDDAVGAEERAAVLDLDERPGPLDRRPAVGDAVDRRGDRSTPDSVGSARGDARAGAAPSRRRPEQLVELGEQRVLRPVVDEPRGGVGGGERLAPDLDRAAGDDDLGVRAGPARAARTAWRDFASASIVTVQVLTRTRSARLRRRRRP